MPQPRQAGRLRYLILAETGGDVFRLSSAMPLSLKPKDAWQPLPAADWNADAARHLLRRAGWTARADDVERAVREGLAATLERLFPESPPRLPMPRLVTRLQQNSPPLGMSLQAMSSDERLRSIRETSERARIGVQELSLQWLQFAAQPDSAAVAKWVLFLSDVYVVSADKVRNPVWLHEHFDLLTRHGFGPAPALTKAISRSPAMVVYLDLNQSQRRAPNENFARELFELFVLGEGNYSEQDIKEAARAFTGYRTQGQTGGFKYFPQQSDPGEKKVFGTTGNFSGDDIIELAYSQKAASTFLPREMAKFYLSDSPLPPEYLTAIGDAWREGGFELRALVRSFFGSRLFFAPEFRGNLIKSPLQFYLGLVQDLQLDVAPVPRFTLTPLRQMGQLVFHPPNVRGWVGGRMWINSATLTGRRQLVETLFNPIDENTLTGDEHFELVAARSNGRGPFSVPDERLLPLASPDPAEAARKLAGAFLSDPAAAGSQDKLRQYIASAGDDEKQQLRRLRRAAVTVLQSPEYQLC